jgi:chaperonin GroES
LSAKYTIRKEAFYEGSSLGTRLLIKPYEEEKKTSGGIVLPDAAKEKQMTAKVIAVGEKVEDIDLKENDKVLYSKYSGTEIKIDEDDYIIIDQMIS